MGRMNKFDVIIAGAGSIGVPTAMVLGEMKVRTLVLDMNPSPGQGENKHAIGGIRATHSNPAKIETCLRSLEIFSTWEDLHGDDIEWLEGGYLFPVYREYEEKSLKKILPTQKNHRLNIDYVKPERIQEIVPGINPKGLRGGTFSPNDGSASPLLAINAFYRHAVRLGVKFRFKEKIISIQTENGRTKGVQTDVATYQAPVIIDSAGPFSQALCRTAGVDIPMMPDSHEGAITEPVQPFFSTMVVDLRPGPGSSNCYFYQNRHGQVIFCLTPNPLIVGLDKGETSAFLPQIGALMIRMIPRLRHIRVRRVWRGLYPMTPDGSPIVGWNRNLEGLFHATGMCGQGFMLGPGVAEVIARTLTSQNRGTDEMILETFSPDRDFQRPEALK